MLHHGYPHYPGDLPGCEACEALTDALDRLDWILAAAADDAARARHDVDIYEDTRAASALARRIQEAVAAVEEARAFPFPEDV